MLVDRHHARYLIDLAQVAQGKSAQQLAPLKDRLDAFLGTLGGAASPAARRAFEEAMQRLPKNDRPWCAVRRPDPEALAGGPPAALAGGPRAALAGGPPAALLLLGQVDDDPDGEEDGNRLPAPGTEPGPWDGLHTALRRWDTVEIQRWIGPLGWQQPRAPLELTQDPELAGPSASVRRPVDPAPDSTAEAATLAAQEVDERSKKTLRVVGIAAAATGGGALLLGLGRALGRPSRTPLGAPAGAKEVTP